MTIRGGGGGGFYEADDETKGNKLLWEDTTCASRLGMLGVNDSYNLHNRTHQSHDGQFI